MTAQTKLARRMLAKALAEMAANDNNPPKITKGPHAGRVDLNHMRYQRGSSRWGK